MKLDKLVISVKQKCSEVVSRCAYFSETRLLKHGQIFLITLMRAAVEIAAGVQVYLMRFECIENEIEGEFHEGRSTLSKVVFALDMIDRFIDAFVPVTRLQYFAEEEILVKGWKEALHTVDLAKESLIQVEHVNRACSDAFTDTQETSFNPLDDEGFEEDENRMRILFSAIMDATVHVYGDREYKAQIAFDVDRQRNLKIKKLLDQIRKIAKADARADTAISVESMLDATSVYDAFVRQYQLGSILDRLAKKTSSLRDEIGDTIKASWSQLGFDMDDDRAFEMIETFLETSRKNSSVEDENGKASGPSLDVEQRPRVFANAGYLGTVEQANRDGNVIVVTTQYKKPPSPFNEDLYPEESIELPDFYGPSARSCQWDQFKISLEAKFRLVVMEACWIWDGEELISVWDGPSLWTAIENCMPPPPAPIEKEGIKLESDSDEESEPEDEDEHENLLVESKKSSEGKDSLIKWIKEGCRIFVCGPFKPLAIIEAARDMPTSDDLRTAAIYMSAYSNNPHVCRASCHLLLFLVSRGPREILVARADYAWRSGIIELLIQATKRFRRDIDHVELALRVVANVLQKCPKACVDIGTSWNPIKIISYSQDYKSSVKKFGGIQAMLCSIICSLSMHGGTCVRVRLGEAAVDAVLGALRAPAPTEELVRCICQGLAALSQEPGNARLIFQPKDEVLMHEQKSYQKKGMKKKNTRGPSWLPRTIVGLFRAREVRNNVEILYRLIHCCNSVLLCAAVAGKSESVDVFEGVALGELGKAVMQLMARWEHVQLDTRCVQLLQTIGRVGDNEVRVALASAGLPKLLSEEFRSAVDTLPCDGISNLLNAIISTTRGGIQESECRVLLHDGILPAISTSMDRFPVASQTQTACINALSHLCILAETKWHIYRTSMHKQIISAMRNNGSDSTLVSSASKALIRLVQSASTLEERSAEKEFMELQFQATVAIAREEMEIKMEKAQAEAAKAAEEAAVKVSEAFWEGKEVVAEETDEEARKDAASIDTSLRVPKPDSAILRLLKSNALSQALACLKLQNRDTTVIVEIFNFLRILLVSSAVQIEFCGEGIQIDKDVATDKEILTKAYLEEKVAENVVQILLKNGKNSLIMGAGGCLLRSMCCSTKELYESTILANAHNIMLEATMSDQHCSSQKFLLGVMGALSEYILRGVTDSGSTKKRANSQKIPKFVLDIVGKEASVLMHIIEKCVEAHLKEPEVLTVSLDLVAQILNVANKYIFESVPSLRGKLIDLVHRSLNAHQSSASVASASIQVAATLVHDAKTGLQMFHVGVCHLVIDAFDKYAQSSADIVHGTCKLVYILASSRTVRQMLKANFKGIRNKLSEGFAIHCHSSKKVKKWGKDAMNKLALPG